MRPPPNAAPNAVADAPQKPAAFKHFGASLGLTRTGTTALIQQIEDGFPFSRMQSLESNSGMSLALLASIVGIPERTLARRRASGKLTQDESERLLRIARVFEEAIDFFEGDTDSAVTWLTTPKKAFGNRQPILYSRTELGAQEVTDLLGRLAHGVFS